MKRKVIKHGPSSYVVSLPSIWIKKNGVKKGSEVDVTEQDNNLLVGTDIKPQPLSVNMDISGLDRTSIMYIIRGFYRLGYNTVNLSFDNATTTHLRTGAKMTTLSVIHLEANRLIGFEVIEEKEHSCIIKCIQDDSLKDFDSVLRRIFFLLLSTTEDFVKGVKEKDNDLLDTIEEKHNTITKFVSYCLRLLSVRNHIIPKKTPYYFNIIICLEQITDVIQHAARDARGSKRKISKEVIDILDTLLEGITVFYKLFYEYSKEKIIVMNSHRYKIEKKVKSLPDSLPSLDITLGNNAFTIQEILYVLIGARSALEYL